MAERIPIEQLSRQPLVRGTSCFTTPDGHTGYKTEDVQVSALVRIAGALERLVALKEAGRPAPAAGSAAALQQELDEVLADLTGYGWSLARLTVLGQNPLGEWAEAEEAQQELGYLQLQIQALEARRLLVVHLLAAQQEGGQPNG